MKFLPLKKLSEEKGIPVSTLRVLVRNGLPHYQSPGGRKIRVSAEEFDVWFRENYRVTSVRGTSDIDRIIDEALTAVGCR